MSFKVNDTILYGAQGVCKIAEISERKFSDKSMEYYVLKPVQDEKATLFVPVNNEKLLDKMRRVLTAAEICELVKVLPDENTMWIENETQRKEKYKEILTNGDRVELVRLIKTLHQRQIDQKDKGKKLHISDDRFMKEAIRMLHAEFAHVLDIQFEQVLPFILQEF